MREVSKAEFWTRINPMDVHSHIVNARFPYTSEFYLRSDPHRRAVGKIVGRLENALQVNDYFLAD